MSARVFAASTLTAVFVAYGCAAPIKSVPPLHEAPARSLRSSSVITLKNNGTEISGRASVVVKAPAFLRVEVLGPLGSVVALLIYNGEHLYVYSDGIGKTYGALDLDSALPLHPETIVRALTGDIHGIKDLSMASDGSGLNMVRYAGGAKTASARLGDFRALDGAQVPFSIVIEDAKTGKTISIEHSRVEINPDVPEGTFAPPDIAAP